MKKVYRPVIIATTFCLLLALQGIAQDETPPPPPPPAQAESAETLPPMITPDKPEMIAPVPPVPEITGDDNGVIIRQKGKKSAKITVELNGGDVRVNGKPISEFKDKNVSVSRIPPGEYSITSDDGDVSLFRQKVINQRELDNLQRNLAQQQREVEVNVQQALRAQNQALALQDKTFRRAMSNDAYLGVGSKKSSDDGALVVDISPASPADKAGLKKGDIITKVNEKGIHNPDDLFNVIHGFRPGDKVKITCKRDGKDVTANAVLDKSKNGQAYNFHYKYQYPSPGVQEYRGWDRDESDGQPKLGLKAQDNEDGKGVDVMEVVSGSAAEKAGLKKGDNIVRFDGDEVNSAEELADHVRDARGKAKVPVSLIRDGKPQDIEVHIPRKLKTEEL